MHDVSLRETIARTLCSEWGYVWDGDPYDDDQVVAENDGDLLDRPSKALFRRGADAILAGPVGLALSAAEARGRAAGLEEAAKVADAKAVFWETADFPFRAKGARTVAQAIRAFAPALDVQYSEAKHVEE